MFYLQLLFSFNKTYQKCKMNRSFSNEVVILYGINQILRRRIYKTDRKKNGQKVDIYCMDYFFYHVCVRGSFDGKT